MNILNLLSRKKSSYRVGNNRGIKPEPHKSLSLRSRIMPVPLPNKLIIPLSEPRSEAASVLVEVGEYVFKGQLIAKHEHGVNVHAPTSGTVTAISPHPVADSQQSLQTCLHLHSDGKDVWIKLAAKQALEHLSREDIFRIIQAAGIAGLGGAGFSTARKMRSSFDHSIDTLIINAVECEPYITADEALIREFPQRVIEGVLIVKKLCNAKQCVIAIEAGMSDAIAALRKKLPKSIELKLIPEKYPNGNEKLLIHRLTGRQVKPDEFPKDIGILLQNVGTCAAIYQAVMESRPLISRISTVTGDCLKTPKNFEVLIGTPVSHLLELCGINYHKLSRLIIGGPLMGVSLESAHVPMAKTSNCLIAGSLQEFPAPAPQRDCIRCGDCANVCPVNLMPQQLYVFARNGEAQMAQTHGLLDCIECGACAYVCPSKIPLVNYYRKSKSELKLLEENSQRSNYWQQRFEQNKLRKQTRKLKQASIKLSRQKSPISDAAVNDAPFSKQLATQNIADAVARVKLKRQQLKKPAQDVKDNNV